MSKGVPNSNPIRKPNKPCAEVGCSNLTRKTYCKNHEENEQETARNYNKYQRDPEVNSFYRSYAWQRVRAMALERDNYLCKRCVKQGRLVTANVVHHVVEVKTDWSLRLDIDNLESVCHACHNAEHKTVPRG